MKLQDRIIPVPQKVTMGVAGPVRFGKAGAASYRICADAEGSLAQNACKRLEEKLARCFGEQTESGTVISLCIKAAPEGIPNADQGYRIVAADNKVEITGFGEPGLFYGVTSFLQCLEEEEGEYRLPAFEVLDYPSLKTRGHFLETRYGTDLMELEDWKQVIDFMVEHKENQLTVSVYGCWQVQFDGRVSEYVFMPFVGYPELKTPVFQKYYSPRQGKWINKQTWTPMYEKDFLGELMAYGRDNGVMVVPMMNSLGHNTLIPRMYPEVSAKDENGEPSFTGYCTSNPRTYALIFDLYDQIIDRYAKPNGVDAFDIGMDEVRDGYAYLAGDVGRVRSPWCRCPACRDKDRGRIIIDHAVKLMKHLKEKGMKTVYMYNDMVVEHKTAHNNGDPQNRADLYRKALVDNDLIDVACLDWWSYRDMREMFQFTTIQPELGFRSTMKPWNGYYNWTFLMNAVKNNYHISSIANAEGAEGIRSYSTWDDSYHRNNQIQADYAWNHTGTGQPQNASARYARRNFPTAQGKANAAFLMMDDLTRWRNRKSIYNDQTSRYELLFLGLNFYQYTYYRKDKDYPRNYPGEMVELLRQRPELVEDLEIMVGLAQEAMALFTDIARTPGCNRTLANRYRYECMNYMNLAQDYLAIMQMDELAGTYAATGDTDLLVKIADTARSQKEARLAQLALLEEVKEAFLVPWSARNQCGPMQYFADVEAYVTETPAGQLKLDFTDMRHIASETFTMLR